jgi:hypothetical protein
MQAVEMPYRRRGSGKIEAGVAPRPVRLLWVGVLVIIGAANLVGLATRAQQKEQQKTNISAAAALWSGRRAG